MIKIDIEQLGLVEYKDAWDKQKEVVSNIIASKSREENYNMKLFLLEHPHVYTLGINGNISNFLINDSFLEKIGAKLYKIERGGDITYHGFGQIVGYPIIDLEYFKMGIKDYIYNLEQVIINVLQRLNIESFRVNGRIGVWTLSNGQYSKICAIGVKVSKFVTMHGFALNVNTDLEYYNHINPCGFTDSGVTSIQKIVGHKYDIDIVYGLISEEFVKYFKIK